LHAEVTKANWGGGGLLDRHGLQGPISCVSFHNRHFVSNGSAIVYLIMVDFNLSFPNKGLISELTELGRVE
jgi:hypothetical protein